MHSVSAIVIVLISLKYAFCWNTFQPPFDSFKKRPIDNPSIPTKTTVHLLSQRLDHFDTNEKRTFPMAYFQRLDFMKPNGPIYLWLDPGWINSEIPLDLDSFLPVVLAKETNGSLFQTTQRYYAYDMRLPHDKDFFKFFNTTQSLADIADFIKFIKSSPHFKSSKVVIIGSETAGTLGTWFRMLYPNLVDAVIAVKAPLLAKKDYKEFYDIVHAAYDKYGTKGCLKKMEYYFHTLGELFNNDTGIATLRKLCDVCDFDNFTMTIDRQYFMHVGIHAKYMARVWVADAHSMKKICDDTPSEVIKMNSRGCWNYHFDSLSSDFYKWVDYYQSCSEFGQFTTTNSEKQPFVYWGPLEFYVEMCNRLFGIDEERIDAGIAETNRMFGGLTPNVTNVVFLWAEWDLYRSLGVQKNLSDSAPAFVISGMSYDNILKVKDDEPKELTETRNRVKALVKNWIASP